MMSVSRYVYNHIGSFNYAKHAICKAVFLGGIAKRFPDLKFSFLESGVGWVVNLLADIMKYLEKRNKNAISNYDPKYLNTDALADLFREFGNVMIHGKEDTFADYLDCLKADFENSEELDEFTACGCDTRDEIRAQFRIFFFGCEADDKINATALQGERDWHCNGMFSSDISHWDVPDMRECVSEAYELVEDGHLNDDDFKDFMSTNPARLHAGMNLDFFKGTRVEAEVEKLRANGRLN